MGAQGLDEANGSESREIRSYLEQDVIEEYDTKSEGEMKEARKGCQQRRMQEAVCGMGMCEDELDEKEGGGGRRSLCTKSFGQRTDLNVFEWRAKWQLIRTPVDPNTS